MAGSWLFGLKRKNVCGCRLELREELREENRSAFGNLWSDAVAGFSVLLLLVFNPQQVQYYSFP